MGKAGRVALLLALGGIVVGCGDDSSTAAKERPFPNVSGPTREFLVPGEDNLVQLYGSEGTEAQRRQASRVIAAWMRARLAEDWRTDCRYLSRKYRKILVEDAHSVSDGKVKNCPQALAYFGEAASGKLVDNFGGEVVSLRVEGSGAFAQYHGTDGRDWIVPLTRERGSWKVDIAAPLDRNK